MADAKTALPELDIKSLPGPDTILRRKLENGITVLTRENFLSPSVVISGFVEAGSLVESPEHAGLADLTASALMRGTQTRSFQQIYESIESIGATLDLGSGKHSTFLRGKALAEDLGVLLELLAEVLITPSFPKEEVERLRAESLTSLAIRDQDTASMSSLAFSALAYPDHPYALPGDGYPETISALSLSDLRRFHGQFFGPAGMVVAVVGAVEAEAAIAAVEAALGGWTNPRQVNQAEVQAVRPPARILRREVELAGKSQSDLVLGVPGPSRFEASFLTAALGNSILGTFGLMGRIGDAVRGEAGLAYYAYSSLGGGPGPGPWKVTAGVDPANVKQAIDLIRKEIRRFTTQPVSASELSDSQANFIGSLPLRLESNEGVAGALVHMERYGLGLDYYQRYPDLVAAITREDILAEARRHLHPDRLAIGIAGPSIDGA